MRTHDWKFSLVAFLLSLALTGTALMVLSGCGPTVAQIRQQIEDAKKTVETLAEASAQLQEMAENTKDPNIIKAVASAQAALELAKAEIPKLEKALEEADQGAPWWTVIGGLVLPWLPRLASLIPGLGIAAEPIARLVAEMLWRTTATRKQKDDDVQPITIVKA